MGGAIVCIKIMERYTKIFSTLRESLTSKRWSYEPLQPASSHQVLKRGSSCAVLAKLARSKKRSTVEEPDPNVLAHAGPSSASASQHWKASVDMSKTPVGRQKVRGSLYRTSSRFRMWRKRAGSGDAATRRRHSSKGTTSSSEREFCDADPRLLGDLCWGDHTGGSGVSANESDTQKDHTGKY